MRGKIIIAMAIAALLSLGLCACGQQGSSSNSSAQQQQQQQQKNAVTVNKVATHTFATMQEVFDAPGESIVWDADETTFGFLFRDGDTYIRVRASLPTGMLAQIDAAYEANDMDTVIGLVAPLPVSEEITVTSPTASEIQALQDSLLED